MFSQDPMKPSEPGVVDLPKESHAKKQEGLSCLIEGQQQEEVEKHPLLTWTGFSPGDVVSFQEARTGQWVVGSVESKTSDGLILDKGRPELQEGLPLPRLRVNTTTEMTGVRCRTCFIP